jgi:YD repeat-containing protein
MWNYRLVQLSDAIGICEVYYDDDGKVMGRTDPLIIIDEVDDLPNVLAMIAQAGKKEVLDE